MVLFFGLLSIIFSFLAYYQIERLRFLILNSLAIISIGISFYLTEGFLGFYAECIMLIVHIVAIFTNDIIKRKLLLFTPFIVFFLYIYLNYNALLVNYMQIFIPIAMSLFSIGVFQNKMSINKVFFIFGLLSLLIYSLYTGTYYVAISNFIGIFILFKQYLTLKTLE